jgi:adenosylcobyric acid synthase
MGRTRYGDTTPAFEIIERSEGKESHADGAVGHDGKVFGTYLHGLFDNEGFRRTLLHNIKPDYQPMGTQSELPSKEEQYDKLAEVVRQSLDIQRIYRICGLRN